MEDAPFTTHTHQRDPVSITQGQLDTSNYTTHTPPHFGTLAAQVGLSEAYQTKCHPQIAPPAGRSPST